MVLTQSLVLLFLAVLAIPRCMGSSEGSCKTNLVESNHDLDELGALQVHHKFETISERDKAQATKALEADAVKDGDFAYLVPCDDDNKAVVWPHHGRVNEETIEEDAWAELDKLPLPSPMWSQAGGQVIPRLIPCKDQKDCGAKEPSTVIPCKGNHLGRFTLESFQNCGEGARKGSPLQWDMFLGLQNGYTLHNGQFSDPHSYFLYTCWGLNKNYYWSRWGRYDTFIGSNGSEYSKGDPHPNQIKLKVKSYDGNKADISTVSYGDKIVLYNPAYNHNELSRSNSRSNTYERREYLYWYSPDYKDYYKKESTCWKFVKAPPLRAPYCWHLNDRIHRDICQVYPLPR